MLLLCACLAQGVWAQFKLIGPGFLPDESGTNLDDQKSSQKANTRLAESVKQFSIAVAPFKGNDGMTQKLATIALFDLERSGQFRSVDTGGIPMDENIRPDLPVWRKQGADALLTGSISRVGEDLYEVRFRLWDAVRNQDLGGQSQRAPASELRRVAHRVSDWAYEKLTGKKGVFSTRIAYVTKSASIFNLWVADSDGEGEQTALRSLTPIISPAWAPNGNQLAYVSFESRKPVVYVHDVATGKRRLVANFTGLNLDPAWSPDGKTMALALSFGENKTKIYLLDVYGLGDSPRLLTNSLGNDKEPIFSPDNQYVYFVSDREGNDQIYRMEASSGRSVQRITASGYPNFSPAISPDGRSLAFVSKVEDASVINVMDVMTGSVIRLTDTIADTKPHFSPDSRMIIYSTKNGSREVLVTSTLDGKVKALHSRVDGDLREPAWGPWLTPYQLN